MGALAASVSPGLLHRIIADCEGKPNLDICTLGRRTSALARTILTRSNSDAPCCSNIGFFFRSVRAFDQRSPEGQANAKTGAGSVLRTGYSSINTECGCGVDWWPGHDLDEYQPGDGATDASKNVRPN